MNIPEPDREKLLALELDYIRERGPLAKRKITARIAAELKDAKLMSFLESIDRKAENTALLETQILDQRSAIMAENMRLARSLSELNKRVLPQFVDALPKELGVQLTDTYLARAYPTLYPDKSSAEPAIQFFESVKSLSTVQRDGMKELVDQYRRSYGLLADKLQETVDAWEERFATGQAIHVDEIADYERTLDAGRAERKVLQTRLIGALNEILTPEQQESLPKSRTVDRERRATEH